MFDNVRRVIEAAGGTPDDIVKMTVWITDRALRPTINKYWVEMFPDPHSRPARHTVAQRRFHPADADPVRPASAVIGASG